MIGKLRLLWVAGTLCLIASSGHRRYDARVPLNGVNPELPAPRADSMPAAPSGDYVWVEGQWVWHAPTRTYEWMPGYWQRRPPVFLADAPRAEQTAPYSARNAMVGSTAAARRAGAHAASTATPASSAITPA
ncbi:MAG: hypothetical protein ACRENQ_07725 [Gemmatimonadaceae bacterium]